MHYRGDKKFKKNTSPYSIFFSIIMYLYYIISSLQSKLGTYERTC